jgi:hypothetical protein
MCRNSHFFLIPQVANYATFAEIKQKIARKAQKWIICVENNPVNCGMRQRETSNRPKTCGKVNRLK